MKHLALVAIAAIVSGCANYGLINHTTTTTAPDGTVTVERKCDVAISSLMRDASGADVSVSKDCAAKGKADSLSINEKSLDIADKALDRIPKGL